MLCGINTGSRKRRVGEPGHPLRDSAVRNQNQRSLGGTHQSSLSNLSGLRREHTPDSPHSIISRPHTANRRFRLFSLCQFSLFSIPFLADFSKNKKPATEVSRVRVIEGVTDELQLVETKKNSNNSVSATKTYFEGSGDSRNKKPATEVSRVQVIEGVTDELQLVETKKNSNNDVSATKTYSMSPSDYRLLEVVGQGASATVYRAMYVPYNEIVAIKCLDLDRCSITMDDIRKEAQTMSLTYHPNVVKGYCSFVVERNLWFVMPFMAEGSCLQLMKVAFPDGFEEQVIGSILKEILKALEYFHKSGHIHRDVKAGNILLDSSGSVKLSDFGVFASLFEKGDRQRSRNTFVGTPCWMAPEVMRPEGGYDFKADIWSFGITALELAHGHAPFSKYPPMKVLLLTLQNAPPGLDYDRDKKFSKSFKEMIAMCLVKDQTKRPTAEKLLKHAFFKNVKPPELCVKSLFADLPSLWDRMKMLQLKDAEHLALKKIPSSVQEALSQSEYQRGISAWNFDIEDLKVQASLLQDDEGFVETKDDDGSLRNLINNKIPDNKDISEAEEDSDILRILVGKKPHSSESHLVKPLDENSDIPIIDAEGPDGGGLVKETEYKETYLQEIKSQDVIGRSDEVKLNNETDRSPSVLDNVQRWNNKVGKIFQTFTSPLPLCDMSNSTPQRAWTFKRDECEIELPIEGLKSDSRQSSNLCGPLILPSYASSNTLSPGYEDYQEDMHRANVVQTKGRFSVNFVNADIVKDAVTEREYFLLIKVLELQARIGSLTDELTAARLKHAQLQQELRNACSREMKKASNF